MNRLLLAGMVCVLTAAPALAGPIDREHVAEDAKWVMHFDFEQMWQTTAGEKFREERLDDPNVQAGREWVRARYGIDVVDDLHGLTMYGASYEPHTGVAVLIAEYDQEKAKEVVKDEAGHETTTHRDYTLHTWIVQPETGQTATLAFRNNMAIFAGSVNEAKLALDVLDGEKEHLAEDSRLIKDIPEGSVFYGAAVELKGLEAREGFQVLQQAEYVTVAVGEEENKTFLHGRFDAEDEETALRVKDVVDGVRGMVALQAQDAPEQARKLLRALTVEVEDKTVKFDWRIATDDLMKTAEEIEKKRQERRREAVREREEIERN